MWEGTNEPSFFITFILGGEGQFGRAGVRAHLAEQGQRSNQRAVIAHFENPDGLDARVIFEGVRAPDALAARLNQSGFPGATFREGGDIVEVIDFGGGKLDILRGLGREFSIEPRVVFGDAELIEANQYGTVIRQFQELQRRTSVQRPPSQRDVRPVGGGPPAAPAVDEGRPPA